MKKRIGATRRMSMFGALALVVVFASMPASANPTTDYDHAVMTPALPAALPLCLTGVGTLVCAGVAAGAVACYFFCEDAINAITGMYAEHTKNARGSSRDRHQKGQSRQQKDQKRKEERQNRKGGR